MWRGIGDLLRQWREQVLGASLAAAAARVGVPTSTLAHWELTSRLSNLKIRRIDSRYQAGGALADLAWALNTPLGLPPDVTVGIGPRTTWRHSFVSTEPGHERGPVWAWLRPGPQSCDHIRAQVCWGPVGLTLNEHCGPLGVFVTCPVSVPHPPVCAQMEQPGWIDFGRGTLPQELGLTEIKARDVMEIYGFNDYSTIIFTAVIHRILGSQRLAERLIAFGRSERPDLIRHLAHRMTPKTQRHDITDRARFPAGLDLVPTFDASDYKALRGARNVTQRELARAATELWPTKPVDHKVINGLEHGRSVRWSENGLRSRLDTVLGAGGYTGCEPVVTHWMGVRQTQIQFPAYWVGPVNLSLTDERNPADRSTTDIELRWGRWRSLLLLESGTSLTMERCSPEDEPLTVLHDIGWKVRADVGYDPRAVNINGTWHARNRRVAEEVATEARSGYLRLFERTDEEFEQLRHS
jgi:hypothetical protein